MKFLKGILVLTTLIAASHPAHTRGTNDTTETRPATSANTSANSNTNPSANFNESWDSQNSYWRNNYSSRSYYSNSYDYSMYEPAYRYGVDLYNRNPGKLYNQLDQSDLEMGWDRARANSSLNWEKAQMATRDAYNRMYENRDSMTR